MSYKKWFDAHGKKHAKIMERLTHLSTDEVIKYFVFENMVKNEVDFCPLYKDNKKCHGFRRFELLFLRLSQL